MIYVPGWERQTSSSLNTTYFRPAVEGETLLLEAEVVQAGKRLAMTRGVMKRAKDRAIISTCEHHIVNLTGDKPRI